jgi:geranylgeranyl reductase family protein
MMHDVAVIGAGPAGSVAALLLARAGFDTILCERHAMPREKVCGDALIPDSIAVLRRIGLYDEVRARAHAGTRMRFQSPNGISYAVDAEFLAVQRSVLDSILMRAALEAGAHPRRERAAELSHDADGVAIRFADPAAEPLRARIVIVATGADTTLLKPWLPTRVSPSAVAVRGYVRSSHELTDLLASFDRSVRPGYGWIFPLPDGFFNIGCGYFFGARSATPDPRAMFDRFVRKVPIARDVMARATTPPVIKGAVLRCGLNGAPPHPAARVIAIGETIGTTFPFTGEGIGKAMETAELATRAVTAALNADDLTHLNDYTHDIDTLIRPRYTFYSLAERVLEMPLLHDAMAWKARRSAVVQQAIRRVISEDADAPRTFTTRGALRMLLH